MFPTLLQIGPLVISSQGFFLVLAFLTASFFIWRKGKEESLDDLPLMDSLILTCLVSFLSARFFFVLFSANRSFIRTFNFCKYPGFSYFGALIGGILFLRFFSLKQKWDFFKLADVFVFGLIPAQILIRIGNFLDGSFYGKETGLPWGLRFPGLEKAVHPLNLYEIFFLVGVLFLVKKLERQYRLFDWYRNKRGEAAPGFLFLVYLLFYSAFRLLLEFFKESSLYWYGLGWEQWFSLWLLLASLLLFYKRSGGKPGGELCVSLKKRWQNFLAERKKGKLEVLMPVAKRKEKNRRKKSFHFKAGLEAKKK